ncbi:MAG TPA: folylpolyglutamate synthase/dihydrofolate synthase family protein [Candidatus Binatia bacterium]|nr:folylpolyglutamate synthase/dihydrofolate synthase family protein [Candidatus Binatia bacterium]
MASYSEILNKIYNLRGGIIDLRLDRMDQAMALFDHPERKFFSFHIAGTNGKGSTAAMLQSMLCAGQYRVALYTSPHLTSFTERIRVGDQEISPDEVVALAEEVEQRAAAASIQLTFFEFVTVMALVYFGRQEIDLAVVEVGLGGRLDATNLVKPVVSVITTISMDHEAYLGSDLLSIAREKGGIIKPETPVVCGQVAPEVADLLRSIAEERGSRFYLLGDDFNFFLKSGGLFDYRGIKRYLPELSLVLRGRHQRRNAALALAALEAAEDQFPVGDAAVRQGLEVVEWPGRFEIVLDQPTVILDGAHNGEGVKALVEEIEEFGQGRKLKLLFASMEDKDWGLMLRSLSTVADEIVLTRVGMERSADPQQLARQLTDIVPHRVIEDSRTALRALVASARPDDIVLVAGSLYLLGEIRPAALEIKRNHSAASHNC